MSFSRTTSDVPNDFDISGSNHPFRYGGRLAYTQPNTPELSAALYRRQVMSSEALLDDRRSTGSMSKHVSFDASSPCSEIYTSAVPANASKSQERLLDGRKTPEPFPDSKRHPHQTAAFSPVLARAILLGIFPFFFLYFRSWMFPIIIIIIFFNLNNDDWRVLSCLHNREIAPGVDAEPSNANGRLS